MRVARHRPVWWLDIHGASLDLVQAEPRKAPPTSSTLTCNAGPCHAYGDARMRARSVDKSACHRLTSSASTLQGNPSAPTHRLVIAMPDFFPGTG